MKSRIFRFLAIVSVVFIQLGNNIDYLDIGVGESKVVSQKQYNSDISEIQGVSKQVNYNLLLFTANALPENCEEDNYLPPELTAVNAFGDYGNFSNVQSGSSSQETSYSPSNVNLQQENYVPSLSPAERSIAQVANHALEADRTDTLVSQAREARRQTLREAEQDLETLNQEYVSLDIGGLLKNLERSQENLSRELIDMESTMDGISQGEQNRFKNTLANAQALAGNALEVAQEHEKEKAFSSAEAFKGFLELPGQGASEMYKELAAALGLDAPLASPTSEDAAVKKTLMYHGLDPKKQKEVAEKLNLAEKQSLSLADGRVREMLFLHNGYIWGAGETGADCSSFVSSVLPADVRKGSFTTLDYLQMWIYRYTGKFRKPPTYDEKRAALVKKMAHAFKPINIYREQTLQKGDLLVFRLKNLVWGHIFIVTDYNPTTQMVTVLEASQSAGTIRERKLPLLIRIKETGELKLKPGFYALRLLPKNNTACHYKTAGRTQSSGSKGRGKAL